VIGEVPADASGPATPQSPAQPGARADGMSRRSPWAAAAVAAALTCLVWLDIRQVTTLGLAVAGVLLWALFAAGAWLILRTSPRRAVPLILLGGIALQLAALSAPPRTSDDSYRYIWDGRVQAAGTDPYRYVPAAQRLVPLRDPFLWPANGPYCVTRGATPGLPGVAPVSAGRAARPGPALAPGCTRINRPTVPTIYPPVAEAYFAGVDELSPPASGSTPIQAAAALFAVATTVLLLRGLRSLGRDPRLAVLWAWCPAVAVEAGNNAHVDVVAAFLAVAALLTQATEGGRRRALRGGVLLGLAIATKITPILVTPAVLRRHPAATVAAAAGATLAVYLPHLFVVGRGVIGFLPGYLAQQGYRTGGGFELLSLVLPGREATIAAVAVLAGVALAVLRHADPDRPWRGAVAMTGAALAVTTPHYSWYSLLLVAVVALDGRAEWLALAVAGYVTIPRGGWLSYGAAVVIVAAVWLIRRAKQEGRAGPAIPAAKIIWARQPARLERQAATGGPDEGQHPRAVGGPHLAAGPARAER
jgi:Glycosyltransferase family 87